MNPRNLVILAIVSLVLALGAWALDSGRATSAAWRKVDERLFPGLEAKLEQVSALVVTGPEGVTTVARDGERWTVAERGGYAGRVDEVGRLLKALAAAARIEPKTSRAENYGRLGLAGFDEDTSPTARVTLRDDAGRVMADLFVGNRRMRAAGESWYVRQPDEEITWAVEGKLRVPRRTSEWLDAELMTVARDRIVQVFVEPAEGERVELGREDTTATGFEILNLPEGREPKTAFSAGGMLGALDRLRLQDVGPAAEVELPEAPTTVTTFWTEHGLKVACELFEVEEELLCRFTPGIDESRAPQPEMGPVPDEDPTGQPIDPGPTREDLQQEVSDLAAKTDGWIFTLPSWKKTSFVTALPDLLKELPEEAEDDEPPIGDGDGDGNPPPVTVPDPVEGGGGEGEGGSGGGEGGGGDKGSGEGGGDGNG